MMWTQPRATRTVTLVPYTTFFRSDPDRLPPGAYVHLERRCGSGAAQDAGVLIGTRDSGLGTRDSGLGTRDSAPGTRDSGPGTRAAGLRTRHPGLHAFRIFLFPFAVPFPSSPSPVTRTSFIDVPAPHVCSGIPRSTANTSQTRSN